MVKFESEKHLEDYICKNLNEDKNIIDRTDFDLYKRQYKCGNYGIADIVTFNLVKFKDEKILEIYIYELKNEPFNIKHLTQVSRYATYIQNMAKELYSDFSISVYPSVVCLKSPRYDDHYILNIDSFDIPVYEYHIDPDNGFSLQLADGAKLIDEDITNCEYIDNILG